MSDENKPKIIGVKVELSECKHGHVHVSDIQPITDVSIVYDAPDADRVLASSKTFGYTGARTWSKNWDETFGAKDSDDAFN